MTTALLEIVDDPNASMKDITKIIRYDPAITADILRTANSAYFGLKHPAETIQEAGMMLGNKSPCGPGNAQDKRPVNQRRPERL